MIAWNVNGLLRKLSYTDFVEFINAYDVISLSETWISSKHVANLNQKLFHLKKKFHQRIQGFCRTEILTFLKM